MCGLSVGLFGTEEADTCTHLPLIAHYSCNHIITQFTSSYIFRMSVPARELTEKVGVQTQTTIQHTNTHELHWTMPQVLTPHTSHTTKAMIKIKSTCKPPLFNFGTKTQGKNPM